MRNAPSSFRRSLCLLALISAVFWTFLSWVSGQPREEGRETVPADRLPIAGDIPCAEGEQDPRPADIVLSPEQEARSHHVFRQATVITAHDHCFNPGDFDDWRGSGITARVLKLTVDGIYWQGAERHPIPVEAEGWFRRGMLAIETVREMVARSNEAFILIETAEDIRNAWRTEKGGVILSFEGALPLEGTIENLEKYHQAGLRELQPFWSVPSPVKNPDNTLSSFGEEVIREMDRLGIVLDLSHMPDAAFWRSLEISRRPMVVSHTSVFAVEGGSDKVDDRRIRAIASRGGVIALHFLRGYIGARHGPAPSVLELVDNIDYIRNLVGINYVGLGPDWFPQRGRWIRGGQFLWSLHNVAREMVRRGYSDEEIEKVLGGNLLRVYEEVWRMASR